MRLVNFTMNEGNDEYKLFKLNNHTCNKLFNYLEMFTELAFKDRIEYKKIFIKKAITDIYAERLKTNSKDNNSLLSNLLETSFNKCNIDEIKKIIKFYYENLTPNPFSKIDFEKSINNIFNDDKVEYTCVKGELIPRLEQCEIESVKDSLNIQYEDVRKHINKAFNLLNSKDYENSIKESITSVEAIANIILGNKTYSLSPALDKLEKDSGIKIHPALKEGFKKIFGYTSDGNGIRHSGKIGGSSSTIEEATFMLVACSAFCNYLNVLYENSKKLTSK